MTTQPRTAPPAPSLDAEQVAAYLRAHPDFLSHHLDVLAVIEVPHRVAPATSLIERQVAELRRQQARLEQRLVELTHTARNNERVGTRLLALGRGLLEADSLDEVLALVRDVLLNEFAAQEIVIRLIDTGDGTRAEREPARFLARDADAVTAFEPILEPGEPVCGTLTAAQLEHLFGERAQRLGSAAAVPLQSGRALGLIGLASAEATHFHADMGTLFLDQLGELVSAGVARHL